MKIKKKTLILILFLAFLNLALVLGQILYYSQKTAGILTTTHGIPAGNLSANLLKSVQQEFALIADGKKLAVDPDEMKKWIENYARDYTGEKEYRINILSIQTYLENLSAGINIPPVNARFEMNNGKITEFIASQAGRALNISKTLSNIITALTSDSLNNDVTSPTLVIDDVQPDISLDKVNDLGIKSLLGRGDSNFAGSSSSRINNIEVSSNIFNAILLKPGEEFSFVSQLSPVDDLSGYKTELVIKKNKVVPELGGGICQVSTTLFRAVVVAGLPILERHPHSLPVHYYNPQGFDATVYPGSADLRFKNDTPAYILIQSKISGSEISFEIYGTADGRKVSIDGPHQFNIRPNGSMDATLSRTITYTDGTKKQDIFKSHYQSPSLFPTVRNPLE